MDLFEERITSPNMDIEGVAWQNMYQFERWAMHLPVQYETVETVLVLVARALPDLCQQKIASQIHKLLISSFSGGVPELSATLRGRALKGVI